MFNYLKQKNNRDGFTLVETLIAISIFSMSVVGLMTVLARGISDTNYAKHRITASYLAEEGIEYIKNMRDTYVLNDPTSASDGWDKFLVKINNNNCRDIDLGCKFDDNKTLDFTSLEDPNFIFSSCGNTVDCSLYYYEDNGKYSYSQNGSGVNSGFTRVIYIPVLDLAKEVVVYSTVSWSKGSTQYKITFSNNLLKWKE
jgi:prepilin-type N-terminal cleavage/methylation domain-containing protein